LSNYNTTRKYGGEFIYLLPPLWGADGGQSETFEYPGDNSDWRRWDTFLEQTLKDIQDSDMSKGLVIDIWNEPDLSFFWGASKQQWLTLWSRTFKKVKYVQLSIPSLYLYTDGIGKHSHQSGLQVQAYPQFQPSTTNGGTTS
jgi:hypothetical protein